MPGMGKNDMEFNLDDIINEVKGMDGGETPAGRAPSRPAPPTPGRDRGHTPPERPHAKHEERPAAKSRPARQRPSEGSQPSEHIQPRPKRQPPEKAAPARGGNSRLTVVCAGVFVLLMVWGLFNIHPGAEIIKENAPAESPAVSAPPAETQAPAEESPAASQEPEALPEATPTPEPQVHYTIPYGSVVAPAANPANFGAVPVSSASELSAVIEKARQSGLLREDETVVFDPSLEFNTGSYYKDIVYYLDETILAIAWKQIVDGNTVTCMEVKLADASQFRRKITGDAYGSPTDYLSNLYKSTNAVVAMNADFYQFRDYGVMVYDGIVYKCTDKNYVEKDGISYKWYNCLDNCFVTQNGDLLFKYFGEQYSWEELQQFVDDNGVVFSLSFGPVLVDNYEVKTHYDGWYPVGEVNEGYSRAGIGQVDELHYLYMSLNHSDEKAARWTMLEFGQFFQSRGVKSAYAFDGGQTSEIIFNGDIYNHIDKSSERWISDMIYFGTAIPEEVWNNG